MRVKYDQEAKAKAIRLVREHADEYPSEYAAITAVAKRLGMTPETLRKWVRQAGMDEGQAPGVSSEAARAIRELRRKNRELEQAVEILKAATSSFAREHDPLHRCSVGSSTPTGTVSGSCRSAARCPRMA